LTQVRKTQGEAGIVSRDDLIVFGVRPITAI